MKLLDAGVVFDAAAQPAHRRFCFFINSLALSDGRLLVTFRVGSSKDAADEHILIFASADAGKSWAPLSEGPAGRLDGVPGAWRAAHLTELRPGLLVGAFNWFDRSAPGRPLANPQTRGLLPSRLFIMESADGGCTWSSRGEIAPTPGKEYAVTGPLLRLQDGALALPYEEWKSYNDAGPLEVPAMLRLSHDEGRTFGPAMNVAQDPAGRLFFWDARMSVLPKSGQVISLFWTHDRQAGADVNVHVAWGSPDGRQWSYPTDAGFAGQHPTPLALPDGRVAAFYERRREPASLRARISEDGGRTWDRAGELVIYASRAGRESGGRRSLDELWGDMLAYTFGHPWPSLLPDGSIFVAYYAGDAHAMGVRWARLEV